MNVCSDRHTNARGFTLVEILVVVLIIGLGIGIVSFTVGGNRPLVLRNEARQFATQLELVASEAMLGGEVWGVQFYREHNADAGSDASDEVIAWRWLHFREPDSTPAVQTDDGSDGDKDEEKNGDDKKVEQKLGWQLATPRDMKAAGAFSTDVEAVLEIEGKEVQIEALAEKESRKKKTEAGELQPDVWLTPGGEMTPFALQLRFAGDSAGPIVRGDALGRIEVDTQDNGNP